MGSSRWLACWASYTRFEVKNELQSLIMDLAKRTCTCRKWYITSIPCCRAILCIFFNSEVAKKYTNDCYKPPIKKRPLGRPKKKKARKPNEPRNGHSKGLSIAKRCKSCGKIGHNKRSCKGEVGGNSSLPTAAADGPDSRSSRPKQGLLGICQCLYDWCVGHIHVFFQMGSSIFVYHVYSAAYLLGITWFGRIGISRDSMHKRRATGGKKKAWRKKRKYELGRQPANTKLSSNKTVRRIRVRGGNVKWRALRLDTGNYSWGSEAVTRKTRILDVVYNASNNELVRTQTLVKSAIVQVDAAPFKQWYLQHYGVDIGRKKKIAAKKETPEEGEGNTEEREKETKKSNHVARKLEKRQQGRTLDAHIEEQFGGGRLLACISSRPGQCGRSDGYILEGKELEFYMKKIQRKKGKGAAA
ncbi:hypothetical protein SO802_026346 [Lithocarpus litseifolius]|uniref:40S ribosomal protein S8 n=1 Tax=Lithocarpus litseifolius TaxID=425828 RepID=A0AAW2C140_9ROSI